MGSTLSLNLKYLDCVDIATDNLSCKTLSIDGDPINQKFTTNQVEAVSGTFTNRDLTKCDAEGNGNAGEDPNQGYNRFKVWGYSEFYSMLMIKRRQNPGDFYNFFGPLLQMTNPYQKTEYLTFGKFRPAYTSQQFGRDFEVQTNSSMTQYIYYGPGNYKNKLVMDANGLIASQFSSFCIQMPCLRLDVNADGVVPVAGVSCTNGVLRVVINSFTYDGPVPEPGQYISVTATPSTLTREYMQITSATVGADTVILASAPGMVDAVSTKVESVYFGPKITSDGTTTISVRYDNGPLPEVGQYIRVTCTNPAFNTATDGNPIVSVSVGGLKTTVTYTVDTAVPTETAVVTACSLKFDDPSVVADPKGILSNIGIHNSNPTSPLDVIGNVTFRDNLTQFPVFKTLTNSDTQSQVVICDSTQSSNNPLATFDCLDGKIFFQDPSADTDSNFVSIDSKNRVMDLIFINPNGDLPTTFARFDAKLGRVGIGVNSIAQLPTFGGFLVGSLQTNLQTVQISSPSDMTQASQAANLVVGLPGNYNVFRTDAFNKRVGVNVSSPLWDLHVGGEMVRTNPCIMALAQTGAGQSIPNTTATNLLWQARDTASDYGPGTQRTTGTGLSGSPFTHAGLGLTCDVATGQFKYTQMGGVTYKAFIVTAQIGFVSNATGIRQIGLNYYQTDGTTIARTYGTQTVNAASGVITWLNMSQMILVGNNQSFSINVYQSSGAALNIYTTTAFATNIQIRHA